MKMRILGRRRRDDVLAGLEEQVADALAGRIARLEQASAMLNTAQAQGLHLTESERWQVVEWISSGGTPPWEQQ